MEKTYLTDAVIAELEKHGYAVASRECVVSTHLKNESENSRGLQIPMIIAQTRICYRIFEVRCMSLRTTSEIVAREILDAWFDTPVGTDPSDVLAVEQVRAIEQKYARHA